MTNEPDNRDDAATVEMPKPTIAPLVLSLGIVLLAAGAATSLAFICVGAVLFMTGLGMWIGQLLPGRGHCLEPRVAPEMRPHPVLAAPGAVERMRQGMPGYRLRLPVKVHPISAGVKGGIVGGLVMPLPAVAYGLLSGHGIWLPINLLAGMALPGIGQLSIAELEQFHASLFILGIGIHVVVSLILGLMYGVLLPALPEIPKPLAWGALLMPLLWTAASFIALSIFNPAARGRVGWPWFVMSQFIFGIGAALVFMNLKKRSPLRAGVLGGLVGGVLMPAPALAWGILSKHGIWYPINLLADMAAPHASTGVSAGELEQFHPMWFFVAVGVHVVLSIGFGLAFAIVLPRVPAIPDPMSWGALVMPLLWTAASYSLMDVVNPALRDRVDWPWFVASQFVFGVVASIVVVRSEQKSVPPAGHGPEHLADYIHG